MHPVVLDSWTSKNRFCRKNVLGHDFLNTFFLEIDQNYFSRNTPLKCCFLARKGFLGAKLEKNLIARGDTPKITISRVARPEKTCVGTRFFFKNRVCQNRFYRGVYPLTNNVFFIVFTPRNHFRPKKHPVYVASHEK